MPRGTLEDGAEHRIGHLVPAQRERGVSECEVLTDSRILGGGGALCVRHGGPFRSVA